MRIKVRADGRTIVIPVPMSLLALAIRSGNIVKRICRRYVKEEEMKYIEAIDFAVLAKSFKELKQYKGMDIIHVQSGSGEEVRVTV